ncbi:MAG TPA: hypothetical protein VFV33_10135, partial [Gemmatimonadaceae bacterium]|nr:hypothetical protein [Gemmatimonadaceae bacterium]
TFRDACTAAGLHWNQWKRWRKAVEDGDGHDDPDVVALVRDAREAHSMATVEMLATIKTHAPEDWKSAAWLVEYRNGAATRRAEQRRAHHEARLAKAKADDAAKGERAPVVVIELPASLARPREEKT